MTRLLLAVLALAAASAHAQLLQPAPAAPSDMSDQAAMRALDARFANGIAAIVEDRIITVDEVKRELAPLLPQVRAQSRNEQEFRRNLEQVQGDIVASLVDRILLVKEFDKKELQIPASFVQNQFDETLLVDFDGDRARFLAHLRERGMTTLDFRRELAEQIKVGYMRQQMMRSGNVVSPASIEAFYAENRERFPQEDAAKLRLIRLAGITSESPDLLEQTALGILRQLEQGADFAELARQHSQDARRTQGGDWGWINLDSLQPAIAEVARGLQPGQTSGVIRVGDEIFIIRVEERRYKGTQPLEDVRPQIERILVAQMMRESQERMLNRLRSRYFIRLF